MFCCNYFFLTLLSSHFLIWKMFLLIRMPVEKTWGTTACGLRKGRIFAKDSQSFAFYGKRRLSAFEKNPAFRKGLPRKKTVKTDWFGKGKPTGRTSGNAVPRKVAFETGNICPERKKNVRTVCFGGGRKENRIFGRARLRTKHCFGVQGTAFASESILSNKRF